MSVALPTDDITLYPPNRQDEHGWAYPDDPAPYWTGRGSVQLSFGVSSGGADGGGGSGPFRPATTVTGTGYLPEQARPLDGMVADTTAGQFILSACRWVPDPTGGPLGCWTVTLTTRAKVTPPIGAVQL